MKLLGFSIEDWLTLISIISVSIGALIKGFKWAFHSVYEKESENNRQAFNKLSQSVSDSIDAQKTLNEAIEGLRRDLKENNSTLNNHEVRITKLEDREEKNL